MLWRRIVAPAPAGLRRVLRFPSTPRRVARWALRYPDARAWWIRSGGLTARLQHELCCLCDATEFKGTTTLQNGEAESQQQAEDRSLRQMRLGEREGHRLVPTGILGAPRRHSGANSVHPVH